jgi:ACS family hexuronate transporter-like MFS transporter
MPVPLPDLRLPNRGPAWKWWVCGLLLLATMVNYMDRLTLNLMSKPIMEECGLGPRQYGQLESAFGVAFALGAILFGWLVDRWSVRRLYAAAVLLWSLAGFLTGLAPGFLTLLLCRFLLGLAEAGNWPCALRTTQHLLAPGERTLGNSILQSGAAAGAVLTPLVVLGLFALTDTWRYSFMAIGSLGLVWAACWLVSVRGGDLAVVRPPHSPSLVNILGWLVVLYTVDLFAHIPEAVHGVLAAVGAGDWVVPARFPLAVKAAVTVLGIGGVVGWLLRVTRDDDRLPRALFFRRFVALALIVVAINLAWHFFRAWMPLFLQNQHGYSLQQNGWFNMAYYFCADVGSLSSGFATLALARGGMGVHASRCTVFVVCSLLTTTSVAVALLPAGLLLLALLLVVGFATLGLFPAYYSFSQELTFRHQGKLTGSLGCICWMSMALLHEIVGDAGESTRSYSTGVAGAGLLPLVGVAALWLLWGKTPAPKEVPVVEEFAPRLHPEGVKLVSNGTVRAAESTQTPLPDGPGAAGASRDSRQTT